MKKEIAFTINGVYISDPLDPNLTFYKIKHNIPKKYQYSMMSIDTYLFLCNLSNISDDETQKLLFEYV